MGVALRNVRPLIVGLFLGLLAITMSGFANAPTGDAPAYRAIAAAAPGLPSEQIGSAYTARFGIHYLVGLLNQISIVSLDYAYAITWVMVVFAILAVGGVLFRGLDVVSYGLCAALLLLNPYFLRPYVLQIELVQDLVFVLGLGVVLVGLSRIQPAILVLGLIVAMTGRQTTIIVVIAVALWIAFSPEWKARFSQNRHAIAAGCVVLVYAMNSAIRAFVAGFSKPYEPQIPQDTILYRLDELPGNAVELAAHFARTALPLMAVCSVFVALVLVVGVRRVPFQAWGSMLVAGSIVAQPAIIDPQWVGFMFNEQRLSCLALLPAAFAVAVFLERVNTDAVSRRSLVIGAALLAVGSLHHLFSSVGPQGLAQFILIQIVVAAGLFVLVAANRKSLAPRTESAAVEQPALA